MQEVRNSFYGRVEAWRKRSEVFFAPLVDEAARSLSEDQRRLAADALVSLEKDDQVDEELEGWRPEYEESAEQVEEVEAGKGDVKAEDAKGETPRPKRRPGRPRKQPNVARAPTRVTPSILTGYFEELHPAKKRKFEERPPIKRLDAWHEVNSVLIELPSSHSLLIIEQEVMKAAVVIERTVREVDAQVKLDALRECLITSASLRSEVVQIHNQHHGTRARLAAKRKWRAVLRNAGCYRRGRAALIRLGMSRDDRRFKPLLQNDVRSFVVLTSNDQLGDSKRTISWIWENLDFINPKQAPKLNDYCIEGTVFVPNVRAH